MTATGRKSYGYIALMVMMAICIVLGIGCAQFPILYGSPSSASNNETQNMKPNTVPSSTSNYENSTFGFRMSYPTDWIMHEAGPNNMNMVVGFLAPGEDMNNPQDYVVVQVESLPAKQTITVDQYAQAVTNNLNKSYPDFNLLSAKDIEISGLPGKELSYTMSSGQSDYHNILAFTIKNNKAYTITLDSLYDKYSDFESSAEKMINSFEFESSTPVIGGMIGAPLLSQ